jgi:hypothetical protein
MALVWEAPLTVSYLARLIGLAAGVVGLLLLPVEALKQLRIGTMKKLPSAMTPHARTIALSVTGD